ncbi:sensor domain-containing diguanylate cyclase [Cellulomonas denverensis]|uniref:Sensor domain-containing diguanylate cyclase n=1 Tax=Cellulomonas denverensis TaxID=264297 RepID=A0A7X6KWY7_9CELL|nr:sensor domain-containing diguanylate cyclase [Cellulomonas denverensis]
MDGTALGELRRTDATLLLPPGGRSPGRLVAPIRVNGELWGACLIQQAEPFTPDDAARAELVGALAGAAIARTDLAEQVRHLVSDDALTGLNTRRVADEAAHRALESGEETCIVMCDVDGLKQVNDDLGHDAGDDLLRAVAGVLRRAGAGLPGSTVARIGGDEFCLVTQGIPRATVARVMESAVAEAPLPHGASLSYGVASSARGSLGTRTTTRSLFRRADAAQYHAKRAHQAARSRLYRSDDPATVLGRTVSAAVTALSRSGPNRLSRLCALAPAVSEAMGGSAWAVHRELSGAPDGQQWAAVARGGSSGGHLPDVRRIELREGDWVITVESTLPAHDRTVEATLHTLMSLAVLGGS